MGLIFFAFFEKFFVPILTSGGPASFIMPLQIGKTPIVVPRQHQFNEHVNDHQVEFARNVAQRMGTIIPVEDINTLGDIITNYDQIVAGMGYAQFLNGNLIRKLFGFGRGAAAENVYMNGSSSYKCSVFNYGYLGFGLMIFEIVYLYRAYLQKIWKQHWAQFVLIALFLVSVYQRPSVYFPYYFIILYGGAAYLSDYKERCERSREAAIQY